MEATQESCQRKFINAHNALMSFTDNWLSRPIICISNSITIKTKYFLQAILSFDSNAIECLAFVLFGVLIVAVMPCALNIVTIDEGANAMKEKCESHVDFNARWQASRD